jgi:hypothetical protein
MGLKAVWDPVDQRLLAKVEVLPAWQRFASGSFVRGDRRAAGRGGGPRPNRDAKDEIGRVPSPIVAPVVFRDVIALS